MSGLFPQVPVIPALEVTIPTCEWVMPKAVRQPGDWLRTCRRLPPGRPDLLTVSNAYGDEGAERCVAVLYGTRAYVIHYAFEPGSRGRG